MAPETDGVWGPGAEPGLELRRQPNSCCAGFNSDQIEPQDARSLGFPQQPGSGGQSGCRRFWLLAYPGPLGKAGELL